MIKDAKISSIQLSLLIIGFVFGSTPIAAPGSSARQDAWLAFTIGWAAGYVLIGMYIYISILNPSKTLIEILKDSFGKYLGSLIGVLYIWYFIHIASLILRNFEDYMITINYPNTPPAFIAICFVLVVAYALKSGIEVVSRINELLVPQLIFFVLLTFILFIGKYDVKNLFPVLEMGFSPVLKAAFGITTFPFGETVMFLMIFPHLNKKKNILKVSYISITIVGIVLLSSTLRDILALGPDKYFRDIYPPNSTAALIPNIVVEPFITVNLLIGGGVKLCISAYAAVLGITQLFNLDDYKPYILPVITIVIVISIWVFENLPDLFRWNAEVGPYYFSLFQIIIPLLLLVISWIKKKKSKSNIVIEN